MSQPLRKLLGSQLVQNGQKVFLEQLPPQTTLALYFAEDKSPDSKEFLGKLLEFYKEMKKAGRNFEVIFIPLEERSRVIISRWSRGSFITIDGEGRRTKETFLIRKYVVQESSTVILIDGVSGCVINFNGRHKILQDPQGIDFPFKHRPYSQILSSGPLIIINNHHQQTNGSTFSSTPSSPSSSSSSSTSVLGTSSSSSKDVNTNSLPPSGGASTTRAMTIDKTLALPQQIKSDFKGFLFSAYWCPPCRTFCTTLIQVYDRLRKGDKSFQIIFVSSDRSKESFDRFFSIMPWLAVPYEDEKRRQELTDYFNVKAIPSLIIVEEMEEVDGEGEGGEGTAKIITAEGRLEINEDLEALEFPWYPKLVRELKDRHSNTLNHTLSIIYLVGDDDGEYERAERIFHPIASHISKSDMEEAFEPNFFIGTDSELSESLRLYIDLDESSAYIVILDIPHKRYFTIEAAQVRNDTDMAEYLQKFQSSQLQCRVIEGHGYL